MGILVTVRYGKPKYLHTVSYGMPPDGYETVTLPTELCERLDELDTHGNGRRRVIRYLVDKEQKDTGPEHSFDDLARMIEELHTTIPAAVADELEGRR